MSRTRLIFLGLLLQTAFYSQHIDSLSRILKTSKNDTVVINALNQLIEIESANSNEKWPFYNEDIITKCQTFLKNCSANHPLKTFFLKNLAEAISNKAYLAEESGNIPQAIDLYNESLNLYQSIGKKREVGLVFHDLGAIFINQGNINRGLEYHMKSLAIMEAVNDKEGIANSLNSLGVVHSIHGNQELAIEYLTKSLKIQEEIGDREGAANSLNNLGAIYDDKNDYRKAKIYYSKSVEICEEIDDRRTMGTALCNLGSIYHHEGNVEKALDYYRKSLGMMEELGDKAVQAMALLRISWAMAKKGNNSEATLYAMRSMKLSQELGFPESIQMASNTLKNLYVTSQNWKGAYEMQVLYKQMSDSINNDRNKKATIQKAFQYEYDKKATADSIRTTEERKVHAAKLKQEQTQRYALYGGLALVAAFSLFIFNRFRLTRKQKAIIENQKQEVDLAYEKLHERNKEVTDSIRYAKRIQNSLLTNDKYISKELNRLHK